MASSHALDEASAAHASTAAIEDQAPGASANASLTDPAFFDIEEESARLIHANGDKKETDAAEEGVEGVAREDHEVLVHDDVEAGLRRRRYEKRTFLTKTGDWLRDRFTAANGKSLRETFAELGVLGVIRVIFNYPEPGMKLRSTAWLDGLRGLAAFEVFVFHYGDGWVDKGIAYGNVDYGSPDWWRAAFIRTLYASGDGAVCLFFAISGFAISYRILGLLRQRRQLEMYKALTSAILRRGIRLFMPVMFETFTLMLLCRTFPSVPKPVEWEPQETLILELGKWLQKFIDLLAPLRYPDRWYQIQNPYDGGISWTIPLEYYGSLMVYLMLLVVGTLNNMTLRMCLFLGVAFHSFVKDDWIAAQFLLGVAFADTQVLKEHRQKLRQQAGEEEDEPASTWLPFSTKGSSARPGVGVRTRVWKLIKKPFFVVLFIFGFYALGMPPGHLRHAYEDDLMITSRPGFDWYTVPIAWLGLYGYRQMDRYLLCIAGMCMTIGISEIPLLKRGLESRPIQYLGRLSFGLYLCHIFMHPWLKWADPYFHAWVGLEADADWHGREPSFQLFVAWCMMMLFSIPPNLFVAGLFERYLDRSSVKVAKHWEVWCLSWNRKPDAAAATTASSGAANGGIQPATELRQIPPQARSRHPEQAEEVPLTAQEQGRIQLPG